MIFIKQTLIQFFCLQNPITDAGQLTSMRVSMVHLEWWWPWPHAIFIGLCWFQLCFKEFVHVMYKWGQPPLRPVHNMTQGPCVALHCVELAKCENIRIFTFFFMTRRRNARIESESILALLCVATSVNATRRNTNPCNIL